MKTMSIFVQALVMFLLALLRYLPLVWKFVWYDQTILNDAVGLFTIIPPNCAFDVFQKVLPKDTTHTNVANFSRNQICDLLHLCLDNPYFSNNGQRRFHLIKFSF